MFNNEDASKFGSSEFGDGVSNWGDASNNGRSISAVTANNQERSRQFVENYDIIEPVSIGAHSIIWKVKSRIT